MEPKCPGEKFPWETIRPWASNTAVEKSSPSRTASENAVLRMVVPSSSAMETMEFQITVKVMGSMVGVVVAVVAAVMAVPPDGLRVVLPISGVSSSQAAASLRCSARGR